MSDQVRKRKLYFIKSLSSSSKNPEQSRDCIFYVTAAVVIKATFTLYTHRNMYFVPSMCMCIDQNQLGIKDYATLGLVIEAKKTMNKSLQRSAVFKRV